MKTGETPARQLFVVVQRQSASMRMRLAPAQPGGEQWAVVNHELGISPLEFVGGGDPSSLTDAYHVFRRLELPPSSTDGADRLATAFAAWEQALATSGFELRLERRALYGPPLPHTHWQSDTRGVSVRPWDVELTAIEAGLRKIVKLDQVPPTIVRSLEEQVQERSLRVEVVAPQRSAKDGTDSSSVTLLVARDASILVEARSLEQVLLVPGEAPGVSAAVVAMGDLLGYPPCCAERFSRIAEQNDTTLAWALLPGSSAPASPLTQWLQPSLALLSHSPCELSCAASTALGQRLLEALEAKEPGFADRWRSFAARVQVVDQWGNRLALAVDGPLNEARRVNAADVLAAGGPDPDAAERARGLIGREACIDSGGLVVAESDWYAPYVADHRGLVTYY